MAWMSALALFTWAFSTFPKTLGRITAASKPMITTTTMISMSVKPRTERRVREFMDSLRGLLCEWARMIANER
jgi:hypothetical protein